jgi:hypothetical protein
MKHRLSLPLAVSVLLMISCTQSTLQFTPIPISGEAQLWWARVPVDITGDGLTDLVLQDNNGYGGWLGYFEAVDRHTWVKHIIAETAPGGGTFGGGDLDAGDIDLDGDIDVLGLVHTGEWDSASAPTDMYWYSNPGWEPTLIGRTPDFIKDLNLADLNGDRKADLIAITYEEHVMMVFRQDSPSKWTVVLDTTLDNLHEGMDVGDIDGDGDIDIAANGYWVENPGGEMSGEWIIRSIDEKWHNQEGDWSGNACKVFCRDINDDGKTEVFISHSERSGYPVAWYESDDPASGEWTEHIIKDDLPAAHTLQVFDFDLDGDYDVLSGINRSRAMALSIEDSFPVIIFLNEGGQGWTEFLLSEEGIYNGQCADLEGDGDIDIFRLPTHDADSIEVLWNLIR